MKSKLPTKPSALIKLSLKDLAKIERSKKYAVNMGYWHAPENAGTRCEVCLGGSVLAKSLKVPIYEQVLGCEIIDKFGDEIGNKIVSLDNFRRGNIGKALMNLNLRDAFEEYAEKYGTTFEGVTPYEHDKKQFKKDLLVIAAKLKKIGY